MLSGYLLEQTKLVSCIQLVDLGTSKAGLMYISGCCRNKGGWSNVGANKACQIYLSGCLFEQTRLVHCKYLVIVGTGKAGLMYIFCCCRNKQGWYNVYLQLLL